MRKVCIVASVIILILVTLPTIFDIYISLSEILTFIVFTFVVNQIYICIGKYITLRRERKKFELIIQKIEDNLKCQKDIQ